MEKRLWSCMPIFVLGLKHYHVSQASGHLSDLGFSSLIVSSSVVPVQFAQFGGDAID
jgi:hypothetical protein